MTDVEATIRAYLVTVSGITTLTSTRIYADVDLPAGYKPSVGAALVFVTRGGGQDYSSHVLDVSVQFRAFAASAAAARALDRALFDGFNDVKDGNILWTRLEQPGQYLTDPETGWDYVLSFWRVMVRTS